MNGVDVRRLLGTALGAGAMFLAFVSVMFVVMYVQAHAVAPFRPSDKVPMILGGLVSAVFALACAAMCARLLAAQRRLVAIGEGSEDGTEHNLSPSPPTRRAN